MDFFLGSLVFQKFQISQKHLTLDQKNVAANMYTIQTVISRCLGGGLSKIRTTIIPQQYLADKRQESMFSIASC